MKNNFQFSILGESHIRDTANLKKQLIKTKTSIKEKIIKNYFPAIKRAAFVILLIITLYYIQRDLPIVLAHQELVKGLILFFMITLSALLLALTLQIHKEMKQIKKKLGDKTYKWLTKED